jgi:hypothetical protein
MHSIIKQPLLHFLLLGALLFALYSWVGDDELSTQTKEIVITPGRIETLAVNFEKVWQRAPTERELDGIINDFITEEIYYREALAIGLDQDDTIVRRRMRQKMEFITADLAERIEPTENELVEYLKNNKESYRKDPIFSFKQIYLNPDQRQATIETDIQNLLTTLNSQIHPANIDELGDRIMLDASFDSKSQTEVDRLFGNGFGAYLLDAEPNKWAGPIQSGYGIHLVNITERIEGRDPDLEEVKAAVIRDWTNAKSKETSDRFVEALKEQYTISIQKD